MSGGPEPGPVAAECQHPEGAWAGGQDSGAPLHPSTADGMSKALPASLLLPSRPAAGCALTAWGSYHCNPLSQTGTLAKVRGPNLHSTVCDLI